MVRKQAKALTVLYLVPYQPFGVDFAPYQILLVMGAVFVLLAKAGPDKRFVLGEGRLHSTV